MGLDNVFFTLLNLFYSDDGLGDFFSNQNNEPINFYDILQKTWHEKEYDNMIKSYEKSLPSNDEKSFDLNLKEFFYENLLNENFNYNSDFNRDYNQPEEKQSKDYLMDIWQVDPKNITGFNDKVNINDSGVGVSNLSGKNSLEFTEELKNQYSKVFMGNDNYSGDYYQNKKGDFNESIQKESFINSFFYDDLTGNSKHYSDAENNSKNFNSKNDLIFQTMKENNKSDGYVGNFNSSFFWDNQQDLFKEDINRGYDEKQYDLGTDAMSKMDFYFNQNYNSDFGKKNSRDNYFNDRNSNINRENPFIIDNLNSNNNDVLLNKIYSVLASQNNLSGDGRSFGEGVSINVNGNGSNDYNVANIIDEIGSRLRQAMQGSSSKSWYSL